MRADVTHRRAPAPLVRFEAPRKISWFEQPILEVAAVDEMNRTDLVCGNHRARLLHERVATIVEGHSMDHSGVLGTLPQLPSVLGGRSKRLVRDHVLAARQRRLNDGNMKIVGGRIVHDMHKWVGHKRFKTAVRLRDTEGLRLLLGRRLGAGSNGDHIDEAETPYGIDVVNAHETGPDKAHADACHASACLTNS